MARYEQHQKFARIRSSSRIFKRIGGCMDIYCNDEFSINPEIDRALYYIAKGKYYWTFWKGLPPFDYLIKKTRGGRKYLEYTKNGNNVIIPPIIFNALKNNNSFLVVKLIKKEFLEDKIVMGNGKPGQNIKLVRLNDFNTAYQEALRLNLKTRK